jgi:hypothetical protein
MPVLSGQHGENEELLYVMGSCRASSANHFELGMESLLWLSPAIVLSLGRNLEGLEVLQSYTPGVNKHNDLEETFTITAPLEEVWLFLLDIRAPAVVLRAWRMSNRSPRMYTGG